MSGNGPIVDKAALIECCVYGYEITREDGETHEAAIQRGKAPREAWSMTRPRDYAAFVLIYCLGLPFGAAGIVALAYEIGFIVGQVTS